MPMRRSRRANGLETRASLSTSFARASRAVASRVEARSGAERAQSFSVFLRAGSIRQS
jgi:hypothetical protein